MIVQTHPFQSDKFHLINFHPWKLCNMSQIKPTSIVMQKHLKMTLGYLLSWYKNPDRN